MKEITNTFLIPNFFFKVFFLILLFGIFGLNDSIAQNCINTPEGTVTSTPVAGGCDLVIDLCITVSGSPRPKRIEYTINYDSNGDLTKDATQTFVFLPGGSGAPNGTHCLATFAPSEAFLVSGVSCTTDFDATISGYTSAGGGGGNICYEFIGNLTESGGFVEASLPVELTEFKGVAMEESNHLKWSTASEQNVNAFVVERMIDDETEFQEIGRVVAEGNSTVLQTYGWQDIDPLFFGYYRLKIIDLDGSFEYSPIQAIERKSEQLEIKNIYPNPVLTTLTIDFLADTDEVNIEIINIQGKVSIQKNRDIEKGFNQIQLNVNDLPKGIYFLKINNGKQETRQRFVKM
ncbi:MAG: T9SS type A sorting domain-containing protein [Saprospiraceae bacterium]